jgi:class 3 adenylate cyclase
MDAAGLSKLTQRCTLPEVLKLVSEPKELLHAFGKAIGGQAIGVWAADNAQMFFPAPIEPAAVVEQMLAVQERGKALAVKIGIGIHFAECVSIAGGLFGEEADFIEEVAEDDTRGGEIVVTRPVYDRLGDGVRACATRRADIEARGDLWSIVDYGETLHAVEGNDIRYPAPFDDRFFQKLRRAALDDLARDSCNEYRKLTTVAFIKVNRPHQSRLLDVFTALSLADLAIRRVASETHGDVVKSTGAIAIVLFDGEGETLEFARAVVDTNSSFGFNARVGIAKGEVFLFPLEDGGREIAGNAVNVASKLSEDAGIDGILVEASAATPSIIEMGERFRLTISGVELSGCVIHS